MDARSERIVYIVSLLNYDSLISIRKRNDNIVRNAKAM